MATILGMYGIDNFLIDNFFCKIAVRVGKKQLTLGRSGVFKHMGQSRSKYILKVQYFFLSTHSYHVNDEWVEACKA